MIFNFKSGAGTAKQTKYDNTTSGLEATDVQCAVDEVKSEVDVIDGKFENYYTAQQVASLLAQKQNVIKTTSFTATTSAHGNAKGVVNGIPIHAYHVGSMGLVVIPYIRVTGTTNQWWFHVRSDDGGGVVANVTMNFTVLYI